MWYYLSQIPNSCILMFGLIHVLVKKNSVVAKFTKFMTIVLHIR